MPKGVFRTIIGDIPAGMQWIGLHFMFEGEGSEGITATWYYNFKKVILIGGDGVDGIRRNTSIVGEDVFMRGAYLPKRCGAGILREPAWGIIEIGRVDARMRIAPINPLCMCCVA